MCPTAKKLIISRDVVFQEDETWKWGDEYRKDISAVLVWEGIIDNDEEAKANIHAHADTQVAV